MNICKILRAISSVTGIIAGLLVIYLGGIFVSQAIQVQAFNGELALNLWLLSLFTLIVGGNLTGWSILWLMRVFGKCNHHKNCCHQHDGHADAKAN